MGDVESNSILELDEYPPNDGFPAVAEFLSRDPDNETYVFRKFNKWTARTLLYQQAEILALEAELTMLDRQLANQHDIDIDLSMRAWKTMQKQAKTNGEIAKMIELSAKMEAKLQHYRGC